MYILCNRRTGEYAAKNCRGEHDRNFTRDTASVRKFDTFGEASDYSQNFGYDWQIEEY
jgi:hypothetical protein